MPRAFVPSHVGIWPVHSLADDWKAPRSTEQAKREKRAGLVQQEFRELTDEERVKARVEFAGIKAKLEGQ
jgi:hypothetical protein